MREYFWVDTEAALGVSRRVGLAGFGLLNEICGHFYCGSPIPDDPKAVMLAASCTAEEWRELRRVLLLQREIEIQNGVIVPIGTWHRPVKDS